MSTKPKLTTGEEANRFIEKVREKYLSKGDVFPLQDKTVTENGEVKADSEYYGLNKVTVNVLPVMEPITVISSGTEQTINPPSGVTGFSKITVNPIDLENKIVKSTETEQTIIPTTGKDGINQITVSPIISEEITTKSTTTQQVINPSTGKDYIKSVTVEALELEAKTVKSSTTQQTITPTAGKDGLSEITVEPLDLETKTVKSTTTEQTIQPTTGKDGISEITVEALDLETKSITQNGTYTPSQGKDGFDSVTVNVSGEEDRMIKFVQDQPFTITESDFSGLTEIKTNKFRSMSGITQVEVPNNILEIKMGAFSGCRGLQVVKINNPVNFKLSGNFIFQYCSNLQRVEFLNENNPVDFGQAAYPLNSHTFEDCSKLEYINLPEGPKAIPEYTFQGCSSLTNFVIPSTVTVILQNAFQGCSALQTIEIPAAVTRIDFNAFQDCSALESVTFHEGLRNIGMNTAAIIYGPFRDCSSLEILELPASMAYICTAAFSGCSALTSVTIGNATNGSSLTTIGNRAFSDCTNLAEINIYAPKSQVITASSAPWSAPSTCQVNWLGGE